MVKNGSYVTVSAEKVYDMCETRLSNTVDNSSARCRGLVLLMFLSQITLIFAMYVIYVM